MAKSKSRTPKNPEETKKELLKAAMQVFCSTNYSAAKLEDIAKVAGVTRGAISWHFKNKETIIKTLLNETFDIDYYSLFPLYNSEDDPTDILRSIVELLTKDRLNKYNEIVLFNNIQFENFNEQPKIVAHIDDLFTKIFELHSKLIEKGIADESFKQEINPQFETRFFYNFFWGFFTNQHRFFSNYSEEELKKHFEYNIITRILK